MGNLEITKLSPSNITWGSELVNKVFVGSELVWPIFLDHSYICTICLDEKTYSDDDFIIETNIDLHRNTSDTVSTKEFKSAFSINAIKALPEGSTLTSGQMTITKLENGYVKIESNAITAAMAGLPANTWYTPTHNGLIILNRLTAGGGLYACRVLRPTEITPRYETYHYAFYDTLAGATKMYEEYQNKSQNHISNISYYINSYQTPPVAESGMFRLLLPVIFYDTDYPRYFKPYYAQIPKSELDALLPGEKYELLLDYVDGGNFTYSFENPEPAKLQIVKSTGGSFTVTAIFTNTVNPNIVNRDKNSIADENNIFYWEVFDNDGQLFYLNNQREVELFNTTNFKICNECNSVLLPNTIGEVKISYFEEDSRAYLGSPYNYSTHGPTINISRFQSAAIGEELYNINDGFDYKWSVIKTSSTKIKISLIKRLTIDWFHSYSTPFVFANGTYAKLGDVIFSKEYNLSDLNYEIHIHVKNYFDGTYSNLPAEFCSVCGQEFSKVNYNDDWNYQSNPGSKLYAVDIVNVLGNYNSLLFFQLRAWRNSDGTYTISKINDNYFYNSDDKGIYVIESNYNSATDKITATLCYCNEGLRLYVNTSELYVDGKLITSGIYENHNYIDMNGNMGYIFTVDIPYVASNALIPHIHLNSEEKKYYEADQFDDYYVPSFCNNCYTDISEGTEGVVTLELYVNGDLKKTQLVNPSQLGYYDNEFLNYSETNLNCVVKYSQFSSNQHGGVFYLEAYGPSFDYARLYTVEGVNLDGGDHYDFKPLCIHRVREDLIIGKTLHFHLWTQELISSRTPNIYYKLSVNRQIFGVQVNFYDGYTLKETVPFYFPYLNDALDKPVIMKYTDTRAVGLKVENLIGSNYVLITVELPIDLDNSGWSRSDFGFVKYLVKKSELYGRIFQADIKRDHIHSYPNCLPDDVENISNDKYRHNGILLSDYDFRTITNIPWPVYNLYGPTTMTVGISADARTMKYRLEVQKDESILRVTFIPMELPSRTIYMKGNCELYPNTSRIALEANKLYTRTFYYESLNGLPNILVLGPMFIFT